MQEEILFNSNLNGKHLYRFDDGCTKHTDTTSNLQTIVIVFNIHLIISNPGKTYVKQQTATREYLAPESTTWGEVGHASPWISPQQ